ncbi:MAG: hypothetical protein J0G97_19495 [Rhizobium pusense]|jgi:hypothetical protein|nr:hypothetical protein [Agrobacterium pusense]
MMSIKSIVEHWTWGIVAFILVVLAAFGVSGTLDVMAGKPFGSTVAGNLADPNPLYVAVAAVGLVILAARTIAHYRRQKR